MIPPTTVAQRTAILNSSIEHVDRVASELRLLGDLSLEDVPQRARTIWSDRIMEGIVAAHVGGDAALGNTLTDLASSIYDGSVTAGRAASDARTGADALTWLLTHS